MRLLLTIPLAIAGVAALGGCGQNEQALRNSFRTGALAGCQRGDPAARAQLAQAGINADQYCTCAIDRYMQSASIEQIKADTANPNNSAGLRSAAMQCATELMRQSGGAPAGLDANAIAAPAAPPAPPSPDGEEAPAGGNEATEE